MQDFFGSRLLTEDEFAIISHESAMVVLSE